MLRIRRKFSIFVKIILIGTDEKHVTDTEKIFDFRF